MTNESLDDSKLREKLNFRHLSPHDGVEASPERGTSPKGTAQRALSHPEDACIVKNENAPQVKFRRGRKTRNFSGGTTSMADAVAEAMDQGHPKPNGNRQRHSRNQHHNHYHGRGAFHRNSIYRHRQKHTDQTRNYNRFAKFHTGGDHDEFVHSQYQPSGEVPQPVKPSSGADDNPVGSQSAAGAVTVDTDVTYKTFNTRKQVSMPTQTSFPSLLQAAAASASFTAPSLVPLSVISRSLSIFARNDKQAQDKPSMRSDNGPATPSRQSSDGAAATMASLDDRSAFHKTFTILVQLGAEPSTRRAHHYGGTGAAGSGTCSTVNGALPSLLSVDSRDGDSSEPSSLRQQQIVQFTDILWIFFQARRFNRTLPCCFGEDLAAWLREQDNLIYEQRLEEGSVLNKIVAFQIVDEEKTDITSPRVEIGQETATPSVETEEGKSEGDSSSVVSSNNGQVEFIASQLRREDKALEDISQLLNRFEHYQSLYKSSKAMETTLGEEFTQEMRNRLNTLYGWSNIASDLRRKLFTICDMLEIRKYKARKDSLTSAWTGTDVSRSVSSDPGLAELQRKSSTKSPAVKTNDTPFLQSPRTSTILVTRTGSASLTVTACTAMDIVTALADIDYLKSYAEKCLKLRGMRKVLSRVAVIYGHTLWRARQIMQRLCTMTPLASFWKLGDASDSPSSPFLRLHKSMLLECETDLSRCHVGEAHYQAMNLPSSFPVYFALLKVPLDLVYVWLSLRLELTPDREPDRMTTNQLIQDARDCLEAATEVKTFYQDYVQAVVEDQRQLEKLLVDDMAEFEKALKKMFELYLRYVHRWVEYQCMSGVGTRGISREQNQTVIKFLEEEWKFAKRISINVLFGEAEAAHEFCHMNSAILKNMEELLENSLDEVRNHQDEDDFRSDNDEERENEFYSTSSSSSSLADEYEDIARATNCHTSHNKSESSDDRPVVLPVITGAPRKGSIILEQCRRLRTVVNELRNLANRSVSLAKLLRLDLEIAAKLQLTGTLDALLKRLLATDHYLLNTPSRNSEFIMFCNGKAGRKEAVLQFLLNVTCGRDDRFSQTTSAQHGLKLDDCYLLLVKSDGLFSPSSWTGVVKKVMPNADSNFALHHMEVDGVYMVMGDTNLLREQATNFANYVGVDCVKLLDEQCSCHSVVAENMTEMKAQAVQMGQKLSDWLKNITNALRYERSLIELEEVERQNYRDALIQAYSVAFEYHRELMRLTNAAVESDVVRSLADFAVQWCQFVTEVCDEGQGCRPRWAADGINYLQQISDPKVTVHLSDLEFDDLKKVMHKCLTHIIGSRSNATKPSSVGVHKISLAESPTSTSTCPSRNTSRVSLPGLSAEPKHGLKNSPSSTRSSRDDLVAEHPENESYSKRAMREIKHLEQRREEFLRRDLKLIGRVVDRNEVQAAVSLPLKRAGFRWQRLQHFVGRGRFGSVHTALNVDTGQLMAVKQLKLVRKQDHQAMQHLMDEVMNFSKIQHPNLVRYFGAEVHQDEILIFMEYCDEGTLAEACKDIMSEEIVRFYTLSLLQAIGELHRHNIVHRDIKPANIFLANEHRSLKLGDFGSSVRLEGDETMVGELTVYIGTPAYMAPEVCTCFAEGYGRAADIWSLGCVVLEMMTGKPPWHDLFEPMSIVYKVGMGGIPDMPSSRITKDCREFLDHCLVHKPGERWSVDKLLELTFVKVKSGEPNV